MWQMGVYQTLANGEVLLAIGAESDGRTFNDLETYVVPANTWAVFTVIGSVGDASLREALWTRITTEWFPSSGYVRAMDYDIETYGPGNATSDDYTFEVWVPVKKV